MMDLLDRSIADRFGISKSTAHACVLRAVKVILDFNDKYSVVKWPCCEKAIVIAAAFESAYGFPCYSIYCIIKLFFKMTTSSYFTD